jgi:hypothetical protein
MTTTRDTRPSTSTPRRPRADYVPFDVADVVDWEAWLAALNHRTALERPVGDAADEVAARAKERGVEVPF